MWLPTLCSGRHGLCLGRSGCKSCGLGHSDKVKEGKLKIRSFVSRKVGESTSR